MLRLLALVLLGLVLGVDAAANAATPSATQVYVSDRLVVAVRAAPTPRAAPLELVISGTALELLDRRDTYARVRTPSGVAGWVERSYLTPEPTAALRLAELEAKQATAVPPPSSMPGWTGGPDAPWPAPVLLAGLALTALALLALGFAAGFAHRMRRERARLHGLRL